MRKIKLVTISFRFCSIVKPHDNCYLPVSSRAFDIEHGARMPHLAIQIKPRSLK